MLERIRNPEQPEDIRKKRRMSKIFIVVDAVLIALIFFYFTGRGTDDEYKKASVSYGALEFSLSVLPEGSGGDYLATLTSALKDGEKKDVTFNKSVANITLKSGDSVIAGRIIGDGTGTIELKAGETKIYSSRISRQVIDVFAAENPRLVISPERTLLSRDKPYLPVKLTAEINIGEGISTSLEFSHRMEQ